jgi:hypothetical protein
MEPVARGRSTPLRCHTVYNYRFVMGVVIGLRSSRNEFTFDARELRVELPLWPLGAQYLRVELSWTSSERRCRRGGSVDSILSTRTPDETGRWRSARITTSWAGSFEVNERDLPLLLDRWETVESVREEPILRAGQRSKVHDGRSRGRRANLGDDRLAAQAPRSRPQWHPSSGPRHSLALRTVRFRPVIQRLCTGRGHWEWYRV